MTDSTKDGATALGEAFKEAVARPRKPRASKKDKAETSSTKPDFKAPERPGLPERLPDDSPVQALGTQEGIYFFLDALGQLRRNKQSELGRLHILALFGGREYLSATWPIFKLTDDGWVKQADFNHSFIAPVLISSCRAKGVWDPSDRVRGCGTWAEDTGDLVMHCGAKLYRNKAGVVICEDAGIKGDLLYPRRPALPEPSFDNLNTPGPRILSQLETWNFKRGELDEKILLGWVVAALIGQAAPWRPMLWVTGGKGCGKSTLEKFVEWLIGDRAAIKPTATSQAYIYQKIGDSALPVLLDEFEAKDDNKRQQDVIELMRIAASGGELGRGGSENNPRTYTLKSCFAAFSILIPPLAPQDRSRMAICELRPLAHRGDDAELDFDAPGDYDLALGSKDRWASTGRQLRGRILKQWGRYQRTYRAYFHALMKAGHEHRAAAQFGALGAGQDLALYDALEDAHVNAWVALLPPAELNEAKGYLSEPEACLQHLLAATPDLVRHGTRETIAHYLRQARSDAAQDKRTNDPDDSARILAKIGVRVYRDPTMVTPGRGGRDEPVWWMFVSSTHPALAEIFKGTHWKGRPGAPGTWAQALRGHPGASDKAKQMRIDGVAKHWGVTLLWDAVFPPFNEQDDAEEIQEVSAADRNKTENEKGFADA